MGGGSHVPSQTATRAFPWRAQQPFLKDIYGRAQAQADTPIQYYPDSTVAPVDQATLDAQSMGEARARAGSPLLRDAQAYTGAVTRGDFLNSNPYVDEMYDRASAGVRRNFNLSVLPALETRFAGAGGLGSSAYRGALGEAGRGLAGELSGLATDIYGGNYARERGIQDAASTRAEGLAEADYTDINALGDVGQSRRAFQQQFLDDLVKRFNFGQMEPGARLDAYAGRIGGINTPASTAGGTNASDPSFWGGLLNQLLSSSVQGGANAVVGSVL